jgi:hypothetical protein
MRTFTIFFIIFSLLIFPISKLYGCTDVIEIFLSKDSIDDKFKKSISEFSDNMTKIESAVHLKKNNEYKTSVNEAIKTWFSFYSSYAQTPPAQWITSEIWLNQLGEITRKISFLKKLNIEENYDRIHELVAEINSNLVDIFKNTLELTEVDIITSSTKLLNEIKDNNITKEEKRIKFNNILTFMDLLKETSHKGMSSKFVIQYKKSKNIIIEKIKKFDLNSEDHYLKLNELLLQFKEFDTYRKKTLKKSWF